MPDSTSTTYPRPLSAGGSELVREWEASEPSASILLVHGLAEHSGRYELTARTLADNGFHVRSFDLVGFGGSTGARAYVDNWSDYLDQVETHMVDLVEIGRPVILMGQSMGGGIAATYAMTDRISPDLMVLTAPMMGGGAAWQRLASRILMRVVPRIRIPNNFDGADLSSDPSVGEWYHTDPMNFHKTTVKLGSEMFRVMDLLTAEYAKITVPTLVLHGGEDKIVPPAASEPLANLDNVDRKIYDGLRHEIFNEPEGVGILGEVVSWLRTRLAGR